jgi:uncharacterized protein
MRLLIVAAFAAFASMAAPAIAEEARGTILTISAEGTSETRPDMATITLGVTVTGQSAQAAVSENARRTTALVDTLRRAGIAERDLQTAYVSVTTQYASRAGRPALITGYEASNSVRARVRDLDNMGRVVDAAVAAGANSVNGISFSLQEPDAQRDSARRDGISKARARATLYAEALGMTVRRIVSVSESSADGVEQLELTATLTTDNLLNELPQVRSAPILPGEIQTRTNVNVIFELR